MAKVPDPSLYPSNRKEERPKVKPVIKGNVKDKEKSLGRKFRDVFLVRDLEEIKDYIYEDLIIPGFKKAVRGVVDIILDGEIRPQRSSSNGYRVNYKSMSEGGSNRRREHVEPRGRRDFRDIFFDTRGDAEEVLDTLSELISVYRYASIADLYDACDITSSFTDNKYGWTDLSSASVGRTRDGYVLNLPKATLLD